MLQIPGLIGQNIELDLALLDLYMKTNLSVCQKGNHFIIKLLCKLVVMKPFNKVTTLYMENWKVSTNGLQEKIIGCFWLYISGDVLPFSVDKQQLYVCFFRRV